MSFSKKLRMLREDKRLTQEELAKRAGIAQANICKYETGVIIPNIATARRLADALGVTTDCLSEEWGKGADAS